MLRHIFHHRGAAEGCAHFCCTKIEDFGVSFGTFEVFSHVNLHVHCGELTAVIGPNGAGKSTLLRAILGEVPHRGSLRFVDADDRHTGHPVIGYVPQYLRLDVSAPTTVMDLFMACMTARPVWLCSARRYRPRARENLARVHAEHLLDRRLGALSGGELQRVLLALALDPMPNLLLLDEPVSGVDQNGLTLFYEIVADLRAQEDLAILLVSHDLGMVARHADKVVVMAHGIAAQGAPAEVFESPVMERIFGIRPDLRRCCPRGMDAGEEAAAWS
ncbi:metal ABC transporter ATP-binding protein [uncultured Selenomonas sp.]|uniref:metal ABC transporter ATP-binding protein n=1 Tax=uncultured Selenomonas sp. TaxID=159275 RepID=UPI0028D6A72D|nr:metal ABC transporter ATP-binding protein [uncultured Selenomonas sp.]